jgi:iron complex transport system ATP-binding protein
MMPPADSAAHVVDVHHAYGSRTVLRGVTFEAKRGQFVGIVGPNGSGKSTLLRLLLGFLPLQRGSISIYGKAIGTLMRRELARHAAFVPQFYETEVAFTVGEMVAMGRTAHLRTLQPEGPSDRAAMAYAIAAADLTSMEDRPFTELSGGERQRVMLARALAQEAPLLVFDEPNANLDPFHAWQLLELMRARLATGTTLVAALHDLELAARHCDRLLVLADGAIAAIGPPRDVLTTELLERVFRVRATVGEQDGEIWVRIRGAVH